LSAGKLLRIFGLHPAAFPGFVSTHLDRLIVSRFDWLLLILVLDVIGAGCTS
jgi:hypothetical protein